MRWWAEEEGENHLVMWKTIFVSLFLFSIHPLYRFFSLFFPALSCNTHRSAKKCIVFPFLSLKPGSTQISVHSSSLSD